jgi:hypothetical protein
MQPPKIKTSINVTFEVLVAMTMKNAVFWNIPGSGSFNFR